MHTTKIQGEKLQQAEDVEGDVEGDVSPGLRRMLCGCVGWELSLSNT